MSEMMEPVGQAAAPGYPLRYDVEYQEGHSRLLIFVKWLLAIPHFVILYLLGLIAYIITIIAFFSILFTQKYPRGMFNYMVGYQRWYANLAAYILLLRDEYPPFNWEAGGYPVTYEVDYPETLNRWAPLYKWLIIIPNLIVMAIVFIVAYVLVLVAWLAILFTGKLPRGIHDFVVGALRWSYRINVYIYLMRDEYPPFSMK
jgi:hypothetical protein